MPATAVSIQPSATSESHESAALVLPWIYAEEAVDSDSWRVDREEQPTEVLVLPWIYAEEAVDRDSWIVDSGETLTAAFSHQPSADEAVDSDSWIVDSEEPPTKALVLPWVFACADLYCPTRKVLGERAECAFLSAAMDRGLIVSKPYGDSAPYDFIVEARVNHRGHRGHRGRSGNRGIAKAKLNHEVHEGHGGRTKARGTRQKAKAEGRLWKIQVKSVQGKDPLGRYSVNLRKSFSRRYEPGEIDFFAVWIAGAEIWYIVPGWEVFPAKCGHFYPDVRGSRGKYEKYREAWRILGAVDSE